MKTLRYFPVVILFLAIPLFGTGQGMDVTPGTNIIVGTGTTLYIDSGGSLLLEDDATHSPSLLEQGSVVCAGGGDVKVRQYLEKNEWHIISTPVGNEVIGAYLDMYLYSYDETTDAFTNLYQPLTMPLNVGQGYHVWSVAGAADAVILNGTTNTSDVNVTLTVTPSTNHSGWNLLGNPFPCAIDWNGNSGWNLNNVDPTVYLFDAGGSGNYATWNYSTGTGTNGKTDGLIAATQGFWVRTSDTLGNQSSYSLTIPASQRVASATTEFYKDTKQELNTLRLKVQAEKYSDECIIAFTEDATEGFDNMLDAYKLFTKAASPKLYIENANVKYAVDFMNNIEEHESVPVSFLAGADGDFTFTVTGIDGFPDDIPIYLEDKKDNLFMDLRENNEYQFTGTVLDERDRFVIHFANPLGVDDPAMAELNSIRIYSWQKTVIVNIPFVSDGNIAVYNLLGKEIAAGKAVQGKNEISVPDANGYYIVKVVCENGIKTGKVYLR